MLEIEKKDSLFKKFFNHEYKELEKFKKISFAIYLIMGWMCLFTIKPLITNTPKDVLWLLVSGGIAYTLGIVFYKAKKKYMHFIWHLFVLAGSILHYFFILHGCY